MKRFIGLVCFLAVGAAFAADVYTYTITGTNTQPITYSDSLPISGVLDKIEVITSAASTCTVTVASYSGTTAVDTYATKAISNGETATPAVFRPRVIGTTSAGVELAGVVLASGDNSTNLVTTVLSAQYERPMIGGNVKVATTFTAGASTAIVRLFYTKD